MKLIELHEAKAKPKQQFFKTKEEILKWLSENYINNYTINDDLTVDLKGDAVVDLERDGGYNLLPVQFGTVKGSFTFELGKNNKLKSLLGSPILVGGDFNCGGCNSLTTLDGGPKNVIGSYDCSYCSKLVSLKGAPKKVGGFFDCGNCRSLVSLDGCPSEINSDFNCGISKSLASLKGGPRIVGGDYFAARCENLASLEGAPSFVVGVFEIDFNYKLESLKGLENAKINGDINLQNCKKLQSFEFLPKRINGCLWTRGCNSIKSLKDIHKHVEVIGDKFDLPLGIKSNILGLLKIKGLNTVGIQQMPRKKLQIAVEIINKYLPEGNMLDCIDELTDAGLEEFAKL